MNQYKKLFEIDGVELEVQPQAVKRIAEKALERKTGARGLRSIIESMMTDVMFELPSMENVVKCTITKEMVDERGTKPILKKQTAGRKTKNTKEESA